MANSSISTNTPTVHIDLLPSGKAVVSSKEVALRFQKKHNDVLRDINRIRSMVPKSFTERNFAPSEYTDSTGRTLPAFNLTRDAFSLLAMGFTGKVAVMWKLKYLEAFNALEAAAIEQIRLEALQQARALPAVQAEHQAGYLRGMVEGKKIAERRDGLRLLLRAEGYLAKGLNKADTARCLGISRQYLNRLFQRVRKVGV